MYLCHKDTRSSKYQGVGIDKGGSLGTVLEILETHLRYDIIHIGRRDSLSLSTKKKILLFDVLLENSLRGSCSGSLALRGLSACFILSYNVIQSFSF